MIGTLTFTYLKTFLRKKFRLIIESIGFDFNCQPTPKKKGITNK